MATSEPIDPRVRLAISQWPDDAPRGAVSTFCVEHGISRKSFCELRRRVKADRPAAALEPRSRRPRSSPSKLADDVKAQAVQVRAVLEASGLDHGPISVLDKDARDGAGPGALSRVAGPDLPRGRGCQGRAEEEATLGVAPVRVPGTERVLAAGSDRVRADRWAQVRDDRPFFVQPVVKRPRPAPAPKDLPASTRVKKLITAGTFMLMAPKYKVDERHGFEEILVITDGDKITVADLDGEILIEHTRPAPGVTYVGNGRPRGSRPKTQEASPKS